MSTLLERVEPQDGRRRLGRKRAYRPLAVGDMCCFTNRELERHAAAPAIRNDANDRLPGLFARLERSHGPIWRPGISQSGAQPAVTVTYAPCAIERCAFRKSSARLAGTRLRCTA